MPIAPDDHSFIFGGIFMLANRMQAMGDRVTGELTVKQWFVLLVVRDLPNGSTIAEVAADAGSSRQNVAKLLEQLAKKGYVALAPHKGDRRSTAVTMTDKGRAYMAAIRIPGGAFVQRMFRGVPQEDIEAGCRLIRRLIDNLEEMKREER